MSPKTESKLLINLRSYIAKFPGKTIGELGQTFRLPLAEMVEALNTLVNQGLVKTDEDSCDYKYYPDEPDFFVINQLVDKDQPFQTFDITDNAQAINSQGKDNKSIDNLPPDKPEGKNTAADVRDTTTDTLRKEFVTFREDILQSIQEMALSAPKPPQPTEDNETTDASQHSVEELQEAQTRYEQIIEDTNVASANLEKKKSELSDLESEIVQLQCDKDVIAKGIAEAEAELSNLRTSNQKEMDSHASALSEIEVKTKNAMQEYNTFSAELCTIQRDLESLRADRENISCEIQSLRSIKESNVNKSALRKWLEDTIGIPESVALANANARIKEKEEELEALKFRSDKQTELIKTFQSGILSSIEARLVRIGEQLDRRTSLPVMTVDELSETLDRHFANWESQAEDRQSELIAKIEFNNACQVPEKLPGHAARYYLWDFPTYCISAITSNKYFRALAWLALLSLLITSYSINTRLHNSYSHAVAEIDSLEIVNERYKLQQEITSAPLQSPPINQYSLMR